MIEFVSLDPALKLCLEVVLGFNDLWGCSMIELASLQKLACGMSLNLVLLLSSCMVSVFFPPMRLSKNRIEAAFGASIDRFGISPAM